MLLLAIALGTALATSGNGFDHIPLRHHIESAERSWIPILIIVRLIPYVAGRSAARCSRCARRSSSRPRSPRAMGPLRIMFSELLPNMSSTVLVFFTLIIANNILPEAALSFLGAGVQPPSPSWGNLIADGHAAHLDGAVADARPGH